MSVIKRSYQDARYRLRTVQGWLWGWNGIIDLCSSMELAISSIMKATSDDDRPIPGYLLQEISNITFESVDTCESCLEFLVDRLESNSTHVKLKVLKLMRYIVENGHENFRLGLLKKSRGISEATKFSGPPHPLHGNTPYVMVRKAAKALSEILFNTEFGSQTKNADSLPKHPLNFVGIGPGQSFQSGGKPRMEGFGNTGSQLQNKSVGDSIKDGLLKMAEKLGDTSSNHQRELLSTIECTSNYTPPTDVSGKYSQSTYMIASTKSQQIPTKHVSAPKHIPGRAGGGWEDSDDDDDDVEEETPADYKSTDSNKLEQEDRLDNIPEEDYTSEQNVVSSYVDDASTTALLQRTQLKAFLKECSGLNCDKVVEVIKNSLSSSTESNQVLRLLLLLEFLMTSDLVNLERLTQVCCDVLVHVYNTQTGSAHSKSRKLIRILEKLTSHDTILPVGNDQTDILMDT